MYFMMLVGLPGSGKTTFANNYTKNFDGIVISSDSIRKELFGREDIQENSEMVFAVMNQRTVSALTNGISVVYDATNCSAKKRKNILQNIRHINCFKTAVVLGTPIEQCKCNNLQRERKVPVNVIEKMYHNFQFPMEQEGFDMVSIVYTDKSFIDDYNISQTLLGKPDGLVYYDQKNKHHQQTLGNHLLSTYNYVVKNFKNNDLVAIAGLLHDIGKPKVFSMCDKHGNKTEDAHYYNHQYVSSYEAMFFLMDKSFKPFSNLAVEDIVYICQLVSNHMNPYFWEYERTSERYRRYWGDGFYNDIMMLHEADVSSHKDGVVQVGIKKVI